MEDNSAELRYLKNALMGDSDCKIELYPLIHYLNILNPPHGQKREYHHRIETFEAKWNYMCDKIFVCFVKGYCLKSCSSQCMSEFEWKNARKEFVNVSTSLPLPALQNSHGEQDLFQPFKIGDFFEMEFWLEFHKITGREHFLDICRNFIFIYKVKECLYLLISSSCSQLKAIMENKNKKKLLFTRRYERYNYRGRTKFYNPYEFKCQTNKSNTRKEKKKQSTSRKRKIDQVEPEVAKVVLNVVLNENIIQSPPEPDIEIIQPSKIQKISSTNSNDQEVKLSVKKISLVAIEKIIKWIKPSESLLNQIINAREERKKSFSNSVPPTFNKNNNNTKTAIISVESHEPQSYIAVATYQNKSYEQKGIISKSRVELPKDGILSAELAGLRLSCEILDKLRTNSTPTFIIVYGMPVHMAKSFKIRINPRVRSKNKNKKQEPVVNTATVSIRNDVDEPDNIAMVEKVVKVSTVSGQLNVNGQSLELEETFEESDDRYIQSIDRDQAAFPYDPTYQFPIWSILYSLNTRAKWPKENSLIKASLKDNLDESIIALLNSIIRFPLKGNFDVNFQVNYNSLDFTKLKTVLCTIIEYHQKYKYLQRVIKCCISHWMIKERKQLQIKQEKCRLKKEASMSSSKSKKKSIKSNSNSNNIAKSKANTNSNQNLNPAGQPEPKGDCGFTFMNINNTTLLTNAKPSDTILTNFSWQKKKISIKFSRLNEQIPKKALLSAISHIIYMSGCHLLLGGNRNRKSFMTFIKKAVCSGTRSSLQLGQLMCKLDPDSCTWMPPIKHRAMKIHLLAKVVCWLITDYVLAIIKIGFYATETCSNRQQICFYLRETWKSVTDRLKHQFTKDKILTKLDKDSKESSVGKVRFVPKKNNAVRPITSFSNAANKNELDMPKLKMILNYMREKLCPHAVNDHFEILQKWKTFRELWEQKGKPFLYYVRFDIQDAFPSVNIKKLQRILLNSEILEEKPGENKFYVNQYRRFGHRFRGTKLSLLNTSNHASWSASILNRPAIFSEMGTGTVSKINIQELLKKLCEFLDNKTFLFQNRKYTFEYGLPQGWVLSKVLCDIYYGFMEKKHLNGFGTHRMEFYLRTADDYFYAAPSIRNVSNFLMKMNMGFETYRAKINPNKCESNLNVRSDKIVSDKELIPFHGWLFCLSSGHVSRDFSSYAGQDIISTISFLFNKTPSPEDFICGRMKLITPLRLTLILFHPKINCRKQILVNVYEAFLMHAFRFYAMWRTVYPSLDILADKEKTIKLAKGIHSSSRLTIRHLMSYRKFYSDSLTDKSKECCCNGDFKPSGTPDFLNRPVSEDEMKYLFCLAYHVKFTKHSNVFKNTLLPHIDNWMKKAKAGLSQENVNYLRNEIGCGNKLPRNFQLIKK